MGRVVQRLRDRLHQVAGLEEMRPPLIIDPDRIIASVCVGLDERECTRFLLLVDNALAVGQRLLPIQVDVCELLAMPIGVIPQQPGIG